jgi:hypothetical protein
MECGYDGVGIRPARVYDSLTAVRAKTFIIYMRGSVSAPNVQAGTGVQHGSYGSVTRPLSLHYVSGPICSQD